MQFFLFAIIFVLVISQIKCQKETKIIGTPINAADDAEKNTIAFIDVNNRIICTGSVIHPQWIITSSSCIFQIKAIQVRFQVTSDLPAETENRYITGLQIKNAISHPFFIESFLIHDIGLVETLDPFKLTTIPLQIPITDDNFRDKTLLLRGAGKTLDANGNLVDASGLVETQVNIRENRWCRRFMSMFPTKICSTQAYACFGDIGAPLVTLDKKKIIGVVSIPTAVTDVCGRNSLVPAIAYTKVVLYKFWIRKITGL